MDDGICGTCGDNINVPKYPVRSHPDLSQHIISCSNLRKKCCKSVTIGEMSPHHHLGCVCREIPTQSKIYSGIIQYVETRQSKKTIPNPYLCDYCNVQGSEQYLYEYFMNFRKHKKLFYDDDEAIDSIPPIGNIYDSSNDELSDKGKVLERGFVTHAMNIQDKNTLMKQTELTLKNIRHILRNVSYKSGVSPMEGYTLTQDCLLGQPLLLYCNITQSYHMGRIIDSRIIDASYQERLKDHNKIFKSSDSSNADIDSAERLHIDFSLGVTQYLVRFRAGIDGRKVALHQWLFLEEHAVMVGVAAVWIKVSTTSDAKNEDGRMSSDTSSTDQRDFTSVTAPPQTLSKKNKSMFRPANIYIRTVMEMNNIYHGETRRVKAPDEEDYDACAICYGRDESHVFLKLIKDTPQDSDMEIDSMDTVFDDIQAADLYAPPEKVQRYLCSVQAHEESLVENISAALLDEEEKQRIIEEHAFVKFKSH